MLENEAAFRKYFLNNALTIIKICKGGKGIILSAETNRRIFMRSPLDVMQIGQLMGLNQEQARKSIKENCS